MSSVVRTVRFVIDLVGILALVYAAYLIIPWALVDFIVSGGGVNAFGDSLAIWARNLTANILRLVVALMVASLTLGPEAVRIFMGGDRQPPPRF